MSITSVSLDDVKAVVASQMDVSVEEIDGNTRLVNDLGADSFDLVNIIEGFVNQYQIHIEAVDFGRLETVEDLRKFVEEVVLAQAS